MSAADPRDPSSPIASDERMPASRMPALRMPALRMPAEWEPHAATWLAWPHNEETWPGCLEQAEIEYRELVQTIATFEPVRVLTLDATHRRHVERQLPESLRARVTLEIVPSDDAWIRDTGPTFVLAPSGLHAIDWVFNAWGGKYAPWDRDAAVARQVARLAGAEHLPSQLTLEGGALEVDGEGTLIATRSCVISETRNPGVEPAALEAELARLLGIRRIVWIDAELTGDDTDGHVDNLARFVAPARVVCAQAHDDAHPNRASLAGLRRTLGEAKDAHGRSLEIVDLPLPPPIEAESGLLPASYANFLIVNGGVVAPTFGEPSDEVALERLRKCFPSRRVIGVSCRTLVRGFGGPHCLSQQQPAVLPHPRASQ